jgi:hypothetical protein
MEHLDGTMTAVSGSGGRKGMAYDWRAVLAAVEATSLDRELHDLVPQFAE